MESRYSALRTIGTIYKVLAILALIFTVLAMCGILIASTASEEGGIFAGIIGAVGALIYFGGLSLTLYAFGEFIYLLIALEENTRMTANALLQRKQNPNT